MWPTLEILHVLVRTPPHPHGCLHDAATRQIVHAGAVKRRSLSPADAISISRPLRIFMCWLCLCVRVSADEPEGKKKGRTKVTLIIPFSLSLHLNSPWGKRRRRKGDGFHLISPPPRFGNTASFLPPSVRPSVLSVCLCGRRWNKSCPWN